MYFIQIVNAIESIVGYSLDILANIECGKCRAIFKYWIRATSHCCTVSGVVVHRSQPVAAREGAAAYRCDGVWDGEGGQAGAVPKCAAADRCDGVADGEGGQAAAAREGGIANIGNGIGNGECSCESTT